MSVLSRLSVLSVVVAMFASPFAAHAAPKTPPTPEQVVARHAEGVSTLVTASTEALARGSAAAVAKINELDAAGATDEEILAAGQRASRRLGAVVARSLGGLHKMTGGALRILNHIGAADEFKASVRSAAEAAAASIRAAGESARAAVGAAVDAATANE